MLHKRPTNERALTSLHEQGRESKVAHAQAKHMVFAADKPFSSSYNATDNTKKEKKRNSGVLFSNRITKKEEESGKNRYKDAVGKGLFQFCFCSRCVQFFSSVKSVDVNVLLFLWQRKEDVKVNYAGKNHNFSVEVFVISIKTAKNLNKS